MFITGVSPVVLSDMTSGYNVGENIYLEPAFNDLCGFTEAEIAAVLARLAAEGGDWSPPRRWTPMRTFYNGYRFSEDAAAELYNPTLSLYFLKASGRPRASIRAGCSTRIWRWTAASCVYIAELPHGEDLLIAGPATARTGSLIPATGAALRRGGRADARSRISRSWPRCSITSAS